MMQPIQPPCALWRKPPAAIERRLEACLAQVAASRATTGSTTVFFRADDIGVPSPAFERLLATFSLNRVPLALAVVPAWLTRPRWRALCGFAATGRHLYCWHQHGWRHANHQQEGKKQEFGPARAAEALEYDLLRGRQRLEKLMQGEYEPIFTPPWNRCDRRTLQLLARHGYQAVSRSAGAKPDASPQLPDVQVHIDLHTRKEPDTESAWQGLLDEMVYQLQQPVCGIMIHHQRMNTSAFDFLDRLLKMLHAMPQIRFSHLQDLATRHY